MPGWQRFYEQHRDDDFTLISVALEHNGGERARPFVEAARATFPTLVDEAGVTTGVFGFKAIPNGVMVDPAGVVRYVKFGGFSIDNAADVAAVEQFLAGEDPDSPDRQAPYQLSPVERELVATKLRLGRLLAEQGRRDEAVAEWQAALHRDPANLVIRKQIWAARHPEKFHPTIDWAWQREQMERERQAEIAAGICGPDGCPLPGADPGR